MIYIKANPDLKNIFQRLINTMKANVKWNEVFLINNNLLILPGNVRSLFFNFDNRKVFTNIMELPVNESALEDVSDNVMVANALNMVLYAFGKWGSIPGLRVDKDYAQLNALFKAILKDAGIDPGYRDDNFRFYKKGVEVTYEDAIQAALEEGKKEREEETEEAEKKLGLWHNIRWITQPRQFVKEEVSQKERTTNRIGNNFYLAGYRCPDCGEKLHMVLFPEDKEFLIETDEARVYLARAYTCNSCNAFFTPRPGKLLRENDVYVLRFAQDRNAYEDYLELMGRRGDRVSNSKFNEYEADHNGKRRPEPIAEACHDLEDMHEEELLDLEEKMENGFYAEQDMAPFYSRMKEMIRIRKRPESGRGRKKKSEEVFWEEERINSQPEREHKTFWRKMEREKEKLQAVQREEETPKAEFNPGPGVQSRMAEGAAGSSREALVGSSQEARKAGTGVLGETEAASKNGQGEQPAGQQEAKASYDARMTVVDRLSPRQLRELKVKIRDDKRITGEDRKRYLERVGDCLYYHQAKELEQKAETCKDKNYAAVSRMIEEVENAECPMHRKEPILESLREVQKQKAQKEAEALVSSMQPLNTIDRKSYGQLMSRLKQFPEADLSPYQQKLKEYKDAAERQEIASMVKRSNTRDRHALRQLRERLEKQEFSEENVGPVKEQIQEKIKDLDMDAIEEICPDVLHMTFEEGLKAYEEIEKGIFLPELKSNTLEMLDKRLTKIKMDECELLVHKLRQELEGKLSDSSRLHFYDVREIQRGTLDQTEAAIVSNAVSSYAPDLGKYEYPIIICDASRKETGKEGFVLTPDHLFYNSSFSSESIMVSGIEGLHCSTGLLNRGIYINKAGGDRSKLPVGVPAKEWKEFTAVLRDFIEYLQEKPESRTVSYLAKEKHEVKCCYRCGYMYRGGNVCPKCGHKMNN